MVDLIDETFIVAAPAAVAAAVHEPAALRSWWPDLELTVFQDRGQEGVRWNVTGALVGSAEVWLQAWRDGVIVHVYLRADPTRRGSAAQGWSAAPARLARRSVRETDRRARQIKVGVNALKDRLEADRR